MLQKSPFSSPWFIPSFVNSLHHFHSSFVSLFHTFGDIFFLSFVGIQMMMVMRASKKQFLHGSVGTISETVYHLLDHYFRDEDSASVSIFSLNACKERVCVYFSFFFHFLFLSLSLSLWFLFRVVPVSFETRLIQHSHETI